MFEDGEWTEQEVKNVEPVGYVVGCDIALETNVDYIANGFRVTSVLGGMIADMGMERFLERRRELAL